MTFKKDKEILNGSMIGNILMFVWPIMLSNILQITFHFADTVVLGRFASDNALAAVGATSPINIFFTWGLTGLSMGANVLISRYIGAKKYDNMSKAVFSSILIGFVFGLGVTVIGIAFARVFLNLLSTPEDVIIDSILYLRVYFIGAIAIGIYDFAFAVMRANKDTKTPTLYLAISGIVNVVLNLLFVSLFTKKILGVALATVISLYLSAILSIRKLLKSEDIIRLKIDSTLFDKDISLQILKYGIPSALQNQLFSFSNMIIQSSINSFGSAFVSANSAANAIEEYVYVFVDAFPQASLTFTSQLYGAKRYEEIKKLLFINFLLCGTGAFLIGLSINIHGSFFLSLVSTESEVIELGIYRLKYVTFYLFINGLLDVVVNSIRGMGKANLPTIITMFGVCGLRIIYIFTIFRNYPSYRNLYLCFPLSWTFTLCIQFILWIITYRRLKED